MCAKAADTPEDAVRGFLAAMVWGYGRVGYGAFRTARVLRENPSAGSTLCEAARLARDEGGPAAFRWLAKNRLHQLGVAFATKYLFFCAANGSQTPAPVLDRLVRDWFAHNAGWSPRLDWRPADYDSYVDTLCSWATGLSMDAADLEMLIFTLQASADPSSQWSQPALLGETQEDQQHDAAPEDLTRVLEALEDLGDAFTTLTSTADETEDFERGLRQLRRIVLTLRR